MQNGLWRTVFIRIEAPGAKAKFCEGCLFKKKKNEMINFI